MFKRILSALIGKKSDHLIAGTSQHIDATGLQSPHHELVTVYDAYGRELRIARGEWREKVFLPNLRQKWDNAPELYNLIIVGLKDGFAADLVQAAARLVEIDSDLERSHIALGIVQMENGQLDLAEATLRSGMAKAGETGCLLTNLAKVFAGRGEQTLADETLWRAIQADPNQDNGMLWWASIQRERAGERGYLEALRTVAALPGSWRAQLWLARHHLEHQEIDFARALYAEVIAGGMFDGSALMMISGDLGNNGQIPLIVELISPVYNERQHDPMAGLNLLRAYEQLGRADEGEVLLARLYALGVATMKQQLDQFSRAFQDMRQQSAQGVSVDPDSLKIATIALSQPIWHYGLRNADWLFAQKEGESSEVGFFALSHVKDGAERAESQWEDELGRLTRAIPLYLAEATHYWSDHAASCYIQVVEGGGPVVSGCEADGHAFFDTLPPAMKYFVTGEIGCSGEADEAEWQISLSLWNCSTRTKHVTESGKAVQSMLGGLVLNLEKRLLAHIGRKREQPLDLFYLRPTAEVMPIYLVELGQAFMLTLLANGYMSKSSIWGERAMLDWPLTMALHWPTVEVAKLMYISGLGKAFDYKSDVLTEYKERTLQLLLESEHTKSLAFRLAPLVWMAFGMREELQAYIQNLPADSSAGFKAWVQRVTD
ncbi:tetratricopeptide repeat protein [Massilia sp. BJB1822]|nr:tetratricopeptide repeat protein [Massilia sp. BJB1822]